MKTTAIAILISFASLICFSQDLEKEKEAIKKVIQTSYVEGIQNEGDLKKIDAGIHPGFNLLGLGDKEEMWKLPISEWKQRVEKGKKAGKYPKEGDDKVSIKFKSIDITGTAAVAKIEFFIGQKLTYVDYISLYKFGEKWMMVNKVFYKFPEEK